MKKILKNEIINLRNKLIIKCVYKDDASNINYLETVINLNDVMTIIINDKIQKFDFKNLIKLQTKLPFKDNEKLPCKQSDVDHIYENDNFLCLSEIYKKNSN